MLTRSEQQFVRAWVRLRKDSDVDFIQDPATGRFQGSRPHGGGEGGGDKPSSAETLDPKVVEVGGDAWNKSTARRLEREYQQAKPKIEEIVNKAIGQEVAVPEPSDDEDEDEGEPPFEPEEWDMLSKSGQDYVQEHYVEHEVEKYHESEVSNWYDSGQALDQAKQQLVEEYNDNKETEWVENVIEKYRDDLTQGGEYPNRDIPFSDDDILSAINLEYQDGYEGNGDFGVEFDDTALQAPTNLPPPEQGTLPGIEPLKPEGQLTEAMREELTKRIEKAFDKKSQDDSSSLDPPDYLMESAQEFAAEDWSSNLSDKQKFEYAKNNTSIVEDESTEGTGSYADAPKTSGGYFKIDALPKQYDPLNETTGEDYKRTQALARYLSVERTAALFKDRGIKTTADNIKAEIATLDSKLWNSWKSSSTSPNGQLLQLATADELNGRLRVEQIGGDRHAIENMGDDFYKSVGGYDGVKAYVRAKWEVSQYLLDKAGVKELKLYRGLGFDKEILDKGLKQISTEINGFKHLPNMEVERNGAASTSTDPHVSNGWKRDDQRLVLRAVVPRTAAVSVPAYGINMQSEHEVVVAGTAWKAWDAWRQKAPTFDQVPLKIAA
jgi:hypothetical protein